MNSIATDRIEVRWQRRHQGLALTRSHFRDLAVMEHHAANQLHIEMPHLQYALGGFANHGECLDQHGLRVLAVSRSLSKLGSLGRERFVGKGLEPRLKPVDLLDLFVHLAQKALITATENFGRYLTEHQIDLPGMGLKDRLYPCYWVHRGATLCYTGKMINVRNRIILSWLKTPSPDSAN